MATRCPWVVGGAGSGVVPRTARGLAVCVAVLTAGMPLPARSQTPAPAQPQGQAQASSLPSLGPLRLGMTLDEVRAATPGATWQPEQVSRFTGRAYRLRSVPELPLHGLPFEVEVHRRYHEQSIRAQAVLRRGSADTCERTALDWLKAAEPGLGPFAGSTPVSTPPQGGGLQWNTQRLPGGGVTVVPSARPGIPGRTDGETLPISPRASVLAQAYDDDERPRARRALLSGEPARLKLTATHVGQGYELELRAEYLAADRGDDCSLSVKMHRLLLPGLPQPFDAAAHPLRAQASVAVRHLAYGDTPPPAQPTEVTLRCDIERAYGHTRRCSAVGDRVPPALETVALRLAGVLAYDMSGVDRDDPVPLRGVVRVRLSPEDRRPLDFAALPRTPREALVFTAEPGPGDVEGFYPFQARDQGQEADTDLACRVEADGSLLCVPGGPTSGGAFADAAVRLAAAAYRVAPTMRDGSPSVGRVVPLQLAFRLQPASGAAAEAATDAGAAAGPKGAQNRK
jgi:hypothetical protein